MSDEQRKRAREDLSAFDPGITQSLAGLIQTHEWVMMATRAGFTRQEAVYLIAAMVTKNPGSPPAGGKEEKDDG